MSSGAERKSRQPRKSVLFILATLLLIISGVVYLIFIRQSGTQQTSDMATLPPPLQKVEFPAQGVPYPTNWPAELHFPEQFTVLELSSGTMPGSASIGWAAKLRYAGDPRETAALLSSFFIDNNWQVAEDTNLDTGGVLIVIERDSKGSGIVVIDTDAVNSGNSVVIATIFP